MLLLVWNVACLAQHERQFTFVHYGTDKGLSAYDVTGVIQDEAGYIWTATVSGLQRFDGTRFITFRHHPDDPLSIPENHIIQLIRDSNKNLWLLTATGHIGIFDTRHFTFKKVAVQPARPASLLGEKRLFTDSRGHVFLICFRNELLAWNEKNNSFSSSSNFIPLPVKWAIVSLYEAKQTGKYYIGTDSGLVVFNPTTRSLSYRGHNVENEPLIQQLGHILHVAPLLVDSKQRLWFHSWPPTAGGALFYTFDLQHGRIVLKDYNFYPLVKEYHEPAGMIEQKNGTIWIRGTSIFVRYIEKTNDFQLVHNGYINDQSIAYEGINDVHEDREENLWVATNNNGLYRFNPSKQHFLNVRHMNRARNTPGEGGMLSFIPASHGTMLMGAWGNGIYRYDSSFNNIPVNINGIIEKNSVVAWDMCRSHEGNVIWIGTQPGGIYQYDLATNKATYFDVPALEHSTVRQVEEDTHGDLWIGTQSRGLFKYMRGKGPHNFKDRVEKIAAVDARMVTAISVDSTGNLWVGTNTNGVYVIDPNNNKVIQHFTETGAPNQRLQSFAISCIYVYNDTTVVIGGEELNVYNTRTKTMKAIKWPSTLQPGVASIQKDRHGYLWIALSSGICRYSLGSKIFIHFDRIDGIVNDHFMIGASTTLPDGRLVFGSSNQFVVFDPQKINLDDSLPDVTITGFKLLHENLSVDSLMNRKLVELMPDENSVTIDFSALNYWSAFLVKYKLEGIDKDWIRADISNQAVYPYLPPGTYTFMAQTEDSEGKPGKHITTLVLKIKPHFWQTWWFFGLIVFAGVGVFVWVDRMRTQKIRGMEGVRTRIASSLTEDMSNSLSSINITSELAKTKVDNDKERTREYINQISDSSNRMVQAMYDMVWSINPENDTLQHTVERMKTYAAEIESLFSPNIVFQIDEQAPEIRLRMETRYEMLSIFKEAVSNAARHAQAKYIQVNIQYKRPSLTLCIRDDGKGFDVETVELSRGISDMRRRAGTIDASISIKSEINTGTSVKLVITR
jgi:ligand-binding sensor domain-containing protein/two-component sensor histidine kinase